MNHRKYILPVGDKNASLAGPLTLPCHGQKMACGLWSSIPFHGTISWESKHFMALLTSRWYWWAKTIPQYRYTSLYTSIQSNSWRKAYLAIGWEISHLTTFTCWRQTPSRYLVVFFLSSSPQGLEVWTGLRSRSQKNLLEDGQNIQRPSPPPQKQRKKTVQGIWYNP